MTRESTNSRSTTDPTNTIELVPTPEPEPGCCHNMLSLTANTIHLLQFISGALLLSYAVAISLHPPDPQHGIAIMMEIYAVLLLISSTLGFLGLSRPSCKRFSLKISINLAPILAAINALLAFLLMAEKTSFLHYLEDKQHQLFIPDSILSYFEDGLRINIVYFLIFAMGIAELIRYAILQRLKNNFDALDQEQRRDALRNHARSAATSRRRWETNPYNDRNGDNSGNDDGGDGGSLRNDITTPFLPKGKQDSQLPKESGSDSESERSVSTRNASSWWLEPEQEQTESCGDAVTDDAGGSWLSNVFSKNTNSPERNQKKKATPPSFDRDQSSSLFAPVEEDMETGITPWNDEFGRSIRDGNDEPDTSWAQEERDTTRGRASESDRLWSRNENDSTAQNSGTASSTAEPDTSWANED
eukprot:CAMPEP_0197236660 /NCGR_PEP_ID=MMETSP1429-20130617/3699_1 /TAXON_ID=49237 /ORGANISM="Chaetoceros  sp., Strain UNC1202" /LENGTH=415 /DNA_ID=CAMNT_0042695495 /DNA_START=143 /DNA_END=1390 /DNA_ORIENTATION=+